MNNPKRLPSFIHQCMTIGAIPTSYKMSLTYEEQLMWFCNFLENEVIPVVNNNSEVVQELKNWFENLDVQNEIDNKLEEMAESGELEEIIAQYLNSNALICFDSVADLKEATNLINGSFVKTLGYYGVNDGGDGVYKVRTVENTDVVDEASIIALSDASLVAELIISNKVNVLQFGAKKDGTDSTAAIKKAITYIETNIGDDRLDKGYTLYFPQGKYLVTEKIQISKSGVSIIGESLGSVYINSNIENDDVFYFYSDEFSSEVLLGLYYNTIQNIIFGSTVVNAGYCINAKKCINLTIQDCVFNDYENSILVDMGGKNNILNVKFASVGYNNVQGNALKLLDTSDIMVDNIDVLFNVATRKNNNITINSCDGAYFSNMHINGSILLDISEADDLNALSSLFFTNCYFDQSNTSLVTITGTKQNGAYRNITFDNCYFRYATKGIFADSTILENLKINNCLFQNIINKSLDLTGITNLSITNNQFVNNNQNVEEYDVTLSSNDGVIVNGNLFNSNSKYYIKDETDTNMVVINNLFVNGNTTRENISLTKYNGQLGYRRNLSGSGTIANGTNSVEVTHNLGFSPAASDIQLFVRSGDASKQLSISNITNTKFTINTSANVSSTTLVSWLVYSTTL